MTSAIPYCFPDHRILKPDVSFIQAERPPEEQIPRGSMLVIPDLAVEVVSPTEVQHYGYKVAKNLEAGVKLVWVISPETRVVVIYRLDGSIVGTREGGDLDGEDAAPGFRCRVADLSIP